MSERHERLDWLSGFSHPPQGTPERHQQNARATSLMADPRLGPRVREKYHRYVATVVAQQEGGAGLLADAQLRYFQRDYHHRLMNRGSQYLPTSYRIAEAFFESRDDAPGFYLLPEKDYQFSFADFLDYITGSDAPAARLEQGYGFLADHVYNVTSTDPLGSLLLETRGDGAYAVRAASLVRRDDELVVMLSLGEQLPADRLAEMARSVDFSAGMNPAKPEMAEDFETVKSAPELISGSSLLATIALVRFNLRERRMESRCLLRDMGEMFRTWTDQVEVFSGTVEQDHPGFINMVEALDACDAVWEVAKTLTLFPAYLAAKVAWTKALKERTPLGITYPISLKKRRALKDTRTEDRVLFRTISAISVERAAGAPRLEGRAYSPPSFQVAVEGYWRALRDPSAKGTGPGGTEESGRTWVRTHLRYKDKAAPAGQKVVYIKASLSEARLRLEKFRKRAEPQPSPDVPLAALDTELPAAATVAPEKRELPQHGAFVYIMRCHAHTQSLFKVGFTDRDPELRARELSAATAAPLPFMVLHAWAVSDGLAAERSAHRALGSVRISESREFFQLAYEELRAIVDLAVSEWGLG